MEIKPKNWLMLRGLAREERHWGAFPHMVKEQFPQTKVHFLELPGVGKKANQNAFSQIKDYTNQLREEWLALKDENQDPWGILAISMGGMIAMDWCDRFPHDMQAMVLVNSSAGNLSLPHHRFSPLAFGTVLKLFFREDYEEREKAILDLTTNIFRPDQELIKKNASYSADTPIKRASFLRQMAAASRFKIPKELSQEMLILAAKKDRLASYKCSQAIAKHFNRKISYHDQAGHDLPLDDPQWIIDRMKEFLKI